MPYTETSHGQATAYTGVVYHLATSHAVIINIGSNDADGQVPDSVVDQVFSDISEVFGEDSRFELGSFGRQRDYVGDEWSAPTE